MTDDKFTQSETLDIEIDSSSLQSTDKEELQTWTINYDLDTKSEYYNNNHYKTIHNFLGNNGFEYRQHSGDIAVCKMDLEEIVTALDKLYETHPDIKECTKSCLFTSVGDSYSFTELRKEQENIEPSKDKFEMSLQIDKASAKDIFDTVSPEEIECKIRDSFVYPNNLKDTMTCQIDDISDDTIFINWKSNIEISSLDKTIATNHIFADYNKLLDDDKNVNLTMTYAQQTVNLIDEQRRIEFEESKKLVEYDMSTIPLGKQEYENRNEALKRRFESFGFEHIQESGWVSKNGMTDEQAQAILAEAFRENSNYDKITKSMDISTIDDEIYDYMKLERESNSISENNSLTDRFSENRMRQEFGYSISDDNKENEDAFGLE